MTELENKFATVDQYLCGLLVGDDASLDHALAASAAADLPAIQVAPNQGKLLHLLARAIGAKRILEIGTLGGYSTIWLGRAIRHQPSAKLVTLEYEEKHAVVARQNLAHAGLADLVEIIVAPAMESLPKLVERGEAPFDFVFIDADKVHTPEYFEWSLKLTRPGSMIIVDNVVRSGAVSDSATTNAAVLGTRRFLEAAAKNKAVSVTAIQTVGGKGYDGFAIALVNS